MRIARRQFLYLATTGVVGLNSAFRTVFAADAPLVPTAPILASKELPPLIRTGISISLSNALVATDRPTVIWGDVVTLIGEIATGGHSLTIVAREIRFGKNALINASGPISEPSYPPTDRAADGRSAGEAGKNGAAGAHGANGGDVMLAADRVEGAIRIHSPGRAGGNAQGGGNGAVGLRGDAQSQTCKVGGTGGVGGRGGLAGTPGNGGDGGKIRVFETQLGALRPDFDVAKGSPGATAQHGAPGMGGPGGAGGKEERECEINNRR